MRETDVEVLGRPVMVSDKLPKDSCALIQKDKYGRPIEAIAYVNGRLVRREAGGEEGGEDEVG